MSPLPLRRYRAERLLREEFGSWRAQVLGAVCGRLRTKGVQLAPADLEACYAQAWAGLYAELLEGREVANPMGWLTVVTYRRAIDEHRSRAREQLADMFAPEPEDPDVARVAERDLANELDNRADLRHVFEAFRGRLSQRECEAASLCYLQGLPRAEAAERMGIGAKAMRRLMEGHGPGRPGVAGKVGELLGGIRGGGWCDQQASLMRAFAFGVLDPDGERYRLALAHRRECPACRRYVLSLRGLAAVLPPLALPWGLGAGVGAGAGAGAGTGAGAGGTAGAGVGSAGTGTGTGAGAGGAAGAGAGTGAGVGGGTAAGTGAGAGTGFGLSGAVGGAKLATGCLLALGIGCAAVVGLPQRSAGAHTHRAHRAALLAGAPGSGAGAPKTAGTAARPSTTIVHTRAHVQQHMFASTAHAGGSRTAASDQAQREFGLERAARPSTVASTSGTVAGARPATSARAASTNQGSGSGGASRASREFAPEHR